MRRAVITVVGTPRLAATVAGRPLRYVAVVATSLRAGALAVLAAGVPHVAHAQTFQGRVTETTSDEPVAAALVRLVDADGTQRAVTIADSAGVYRLIAPAPGTYRLEAARIGYRNFESPVLEASAGGVYRIDLVLDAAPVELPGLRVETRISNQEADREIRRIIGLAVPSLRFRPIRFPEIQRHIEAGRNLTDLLRWTNTVNLVVSYTTDGPCYSLRGQGCLPVYLNGLRLNRDFMTDLPLDMVHSIVVITPGDGSLAYPGGAVLLYTGAWLR
jgi:hypothetical protein